MLGVSEQLKQFIKSPEDALIATVSDDTIANSQFVAIEDTASYLPIIQSSEVKDND